MNHQELETLGKIHEYCIAQGFNPVLNSFRTFRNKRSGTIVTKSIADEFFYVKREQRGKGKEESGTDNTNTAARLSDQPNYILSGFTPYLQFLATIKRRGALVRHILDA